MIKGIDDILGDAKKKGSEIWTNIKRFSRKKLKNTIDSLNDSLPVIEEAGFVLVRFDVDIAIVPRLFARFRQVKEIGEQERKAILDRTKKQKFLNIILHGLFHGVDIKKEVNIDNMDLKEIELEIGLTPSAKLIFRHKDGQNLIV